MYSRRLRYGLPISDYQACWLWLQRLQPRAIQCAAFPWLQKALTKAAKKAQAKLEKAKRKVAKAAHERSTEAASAQAQAATSLSRDQALGYAILGNLQVWQCPE